MEWYTIDLPTYETSLSIAFVESYKALYKLAKKDGADLSDKDRYTNMDGIFYYGKKGKKKIIFVTPTSNRVIVHETFHAAMHVMDDIGQEFYIENHEAHAWMMDYLFAEISKLNEDLI